MNYFDEIRDKEARKYQENIDAKFGPSEFEFELEREAFIEGFNCATKAIKEKLKEIVDNTHHEDHCSVFNTIIDDKNCDCWKAKLKELGICE
jgi:hypothetical protein